MAWLYKEIPLVGAVFAERQKGNDKRFFECCREDGEVFIWVGRFHFILTRWVRVVRTTAIALLATMMTPFTGVTTISTGAQTATVAMAVGVGITTMDSKRAETTQMPGELEATIGWASEYRVISLEASVCEVRAFLSTQP